MPELLKSHLPHLPAPKVGKVREVYDLEPSTGRPELLIVATDRISAFDATMANGIPDKGAILTTMSAWWMRYLAELGVNPTDHLISTEPAEIDARVGASLPNLYGRTTIAKKAQPFAVECVARGALAGSLYKEYRQQGPGELHGIHLAEGILEGQLLDEPIFTPATKADSGHDENISFATVIDCIGRESAEILRDRTLQMFVAAQKRAQENGLILADTKFEFGETDEGIILIDEALTPDSSRYWDASLYAPGGSPPSFDKQYVRDYLERVGWDKNPPGPELPPNVQQGTLARYREAFERITGEPFASIGNNQD